MSTESGKGLSLTEQEFSVLEAQVKDLISHVETETANRNYWMGVAAKCNTEINALRNSNAQLTQQRDELLKDMQRIAFYDVPDAHAMLSIARAAFTRCAP